MSTLTQHESLRNTHFGAHSADSRAAGKCSVKDNMKLQSKGLAYEKPRATENHLGA